jgi:hypothetical protein
MLAMLAAGTDIGPGAALPGGLVTGPVPSEKS